MDSASVIHRLEDIHQDLGALIVDIKAADAEGSRPAGGQNTGRWLTALRDLEPDAPTGAWGMSAQTARAQVNMPGGVPASEAIVRINRDRKVPQGYWNNVAQAAHEHDIPGCVLCALFCRESHHGAALDSRGEGDRGAAFGVGQVDKRYHTQQGRPDPYSLEHMRQAAGIFADYRNQIAKRHPDWKDKYVLKGAAVAYNSGVGNVVTIERMDRGTTGNDYGADTMARAQAYDRLEIF